MKFIGFYFLSLIRNLYAQAFISPLFLSFFISKNMCSDQLKESGAIESLITLTNSFRAKNNLDPLYEIDSFKKAAENQAQHMCKINTLTHDGETGVGKTLEERLDRFGFSAKKMGENIARQEIKDVEEVFNVWIKSNEHRTNILGDYTYTGAASCVGSDRKVYFVQVFGKDLNNLDLYQQRSKDNKGNKDNKNNKNDEYEINIAGSDDMGNKKFQSNEKININKGKYNNEREKVTETKIITTTEYKPSIISETKTLTPKTSNADVPNTTEKMNTSNFIEPIEPKVDKNNSNDVPLSQILNKIKPVDPSIKPENKPKEKEEQKNYIKIEIRKPEDDKKTDFSSLLEKIFKTKADPINDDKLGNIVEKAVKKALDRLNESNKPLENKNPGKINTELENPEKNKYEKKKDNENKGGKLYDVFAKEGLEDINKIDPYLNPNLNTNKDSQPSNNNTNNKYPNSKNKKKFPNKKNKNSPSKFNKTPKNDDEDNFNSDNIYSDNIDSENSNQDKSDSKGENLNEEKSSEQEIEDEDKSDSEENLNDNKSSEQEIEDEDERKKNLLNKKRNIKKLIPKILKKKIGKISDKKLIDNLLKKEEKPPKKNIPGKNKNKPKKFRKRNIKNLLSANNKKPKKNKSSVDNSPKVEKSIPKSKIEQALAEKLCKSMSLHEILKNKELKMICLEVIDNELT